MKKHLKKIVTVMLSVMMLVCMIPSVPVKAVTQRSVSDQLNSLIRQYANTTASSSQMYYGSQCKGFANWVFKKIFGVYIGAYPENANYKITNAGAQLVGMINPGNLTESTSRTLLQKAKPGDYIQVQRSIAKSGGKCGPHSMIVVDVKENGVQVFDCNSDGRNTIKSYLYTWSKFDYDNRAMSLYHAYDYQEDEPVSPLPDTRLHAWFSFQKMGGEAKNIRLNDMVYLCYRLETEDGKLLESSLGNYTVKETIYFPDGSNLNESYGRSNNNWIGSSFDQLGTYRGVVEINGDYTGSVEVSWTIADSENPVIQKVWITDKNKNGYTINCTVTDNVAVDRVLFPTWTAKGGKDDIQKNWETNSAAKGSKSGDTYTYKVRVSDHNNESGTYYTEIYVYDKSGNLKTNRVEINVQARAAYYGDLDKNGEVTVTDMSTINRAVAGKIKLSEEEKKRADVNGDGMLTEKDSQLVTDYVLKKIHKFPVEIYFGDVNMDGEVNILDSSLISLAIAGNAELSVEAKRRADVNGDGKINSKDVQLVQEYIVENIDKFPAVYYGDVNMDGEVNSVDVSMLLQEVSGKKVLSEEQKKRADVDGDAKITKKDVQLIMQYNVGLIDGFPIEG
ncbi:MAG: GBS Bsp-like repeat-containing protein [Lachnospiraceae bacterium]|nr:GBS Bsp-like repeat-containing protein [Lachnospiraceae bacterium]